jgi:hypothetical protein
MAKITISEALNWRKTLQERHSELVALRNQNSHDEHHYGANVKTIDKIARYDVVELDRMVVTVAREMRLLDAAMKKTNATVHVKDYEQNDDVLGELKALKAA